MDSSPSPPQIEKQLNRMLRNPIFDRAPKLAQLLKYLVMSALDGTEVKESTIAIEVFGRSPSQAVRKDGKSSEDDSLVRTQGVYLRRKLLQYYEENADDPILITGLENRGYKPQFSYNPTTDAMHFYQRGVHCMEHLDTCRDADSAINEFEQALEADPKHASSHSAIAEAYFMVSLYKLDSPPETWITKSVLHAKKALRLDDAMWRPHLVLAGCHASRHEWNVAKDHIATAMKLSPTETHDHAWYAAYLMATRQTQEALRWVSLNAKEKPLRSWTTDTLALFLILDGDDDNAEIALNHSTSNISWNWFHLMVQTTRFLRFTQLTKYQRDYKFYRRLSFHACKCFRDEENKTICGAYDELWKIALEGRTKGRSELKRMIRLREKEYVSPIRIALLSFELNEIDTTIDFLERACDEHHPLLIWLHLWPHFRSLHKEPRFLRLTKRIGLPTPT